MFPIHVIFLGTYQGDSAFFPGGFHSKPGGFSQSYFQSLSLNFLFKSKRKTCFPYFSDRQQGFSCFRRGIFESGTHREITFNATYMQCTTVQRGNSSLRGKLCISHFQKVCQSSLRPCVFGITLQYRHASKPNSSYGRFGCVFHTFEKHARVYDRVYWESFYT